MALTWVPKAFKVILKILQKCAISRLGVVMINTNIWVLLSIYGNFFYLSQIVYEWPLNRFLRLYERFYKSSIFFDIRHLSASMANINICFNWNLLVTLTFLSFLQLFKNGPIVLPKSFKVIMKNLQKFEISGGKRSVI